MRSGWGRWLLVVAVAIASAISVLAPGVAPRALAAEFDCSSYIQNGSFENPVLQPGTYGMSNAEHWSGTYDLMTGYGEAGNQSIFLDQAHMAATQTIATSGLLAGTLMTIHFFQDVGVIVSFGSTTQSFPPSSDLGYTQESISYRLQQDNEAVNLTFSTPYQGGGGPKIDAVTASCGEPTSTATTTPSVTPPLSTATPSAPTISVSYTCGPSFLADDDFPYGSGYAGLYAQAVNVTMNGTLADTDYFTTSRVENAVPPSTTTYIPTTASSTSFPVDFTFYVFFDTHPASTVSFDFVTDVQGFPQSSHIEPMTCPFDYVDPTNTPTGLPTATYPPHAPPVLDLEVVPQLGVPGSPLPYPYVVPSGKVLRIIAGNDVSELVFYAGAGCSGDITGSGAVERDLLAPRAPVFVRARSTVDPNEVTDCATITWADYIGPTATATAPVTPTVTPTEPPTLEPSATSSDTPTQIPTNTATATTMPTDTATTMPTDTATAAPTDTATAAPTDTATTVPTDVPTSTVISATGTIEPSATSISTSTATAETTGSVAVTLTTSDGGNVPDSTTVCVGDVCQTVGATVSSAAVSPTMLIFADLDPGTYPVTAANAAPYTDAGGSVTVTAGENTPVTLTLELPAGSTVVPTQPGGATPITTVTVVPTLGSGGGVVSGPTKPGTTGSGTNNGGTTVTTLPNTGSGSSSSNSALLLLLSILAVGGLGGWMTVRRRRSH